MWIQNYRPAYINRLFIWFLLPWFLPWFLQI
jgi:hypothetical protein